MKRYHVNQNSIVDEVFDRELIMINLLTGTYYTTNEAGAFLWMLVLQGASLPELVALAATRYDVPAEVVGGHVQAFVDRLREHELVFESDAPGEPPVPPADGAKAPYQPPTLAVFSDMQELLLLDPIHDVNEHGWPYVDKANG